MADAPLPGTAVFDRLRADPRYSHFAFHAALDVPEMLVAGRERQYLQVFFNRRTANATAISDADLDAYASAYSAPGAMRAGFEVYRAFGQDEPPPTTSLTAEPLDLDYKHEIIRRVHQERDQAPAVRAEMQRAQRHRDVITLVATALVLHRIHDHDRVHECR